MRKFLKMILRHKFRSQQSDNFLHRYYFGLAAIVHSLYMICTKYAGIYFVRRFRERKLMKQFVLEFTILLVFSVSFINDILINFSRFVPTYVEKLIPCCIGEHKVSVKTIDHKALAS